MFFATVLRGGGASACIYDLNYSRRIQVAPLSLSLSYQDDGQPCPVAKKEWRPPGCYHPSVLKIGLTGGIACGKSFVLNEFRRWGVHCIDADEVAHQVILPGEPAYGDIVEHFGARVLGEDSAIDRTKLGAAVFGDERQRKRLNRIVHPRIHQELDRRLARLQEKAGAKPALAMVDAALMVETGSYRKYDHVVVVSCRPEQQLERLLGRGGLTRPEAQARIDSQMPVEEKVRFADFVIDNSGDRGRTRVRIREVHRQLLTLSR